jgi:four helix bundle protein
MKDFRQLQVWEKSHALVLELYRATRSFPREEIYGLVSQIRRCSASVAANIAEGCGRKGNGEFHRFLQIAAGSGSELDYHLLLARDLGYIDDGEYRRLIPRVVEIRRMLSALLRKVDADRREV